LRGLLLDTAIALYESCLRRDSTRVGAVAREGNAAVGIPIGDNFGLERYDWHLSASVVSEQGLPQDKQRLSVIGLDLADRSLCAGEQNYFIALSDF
jgi:hypothetical protein